MNEEDIKQFKKELWFNKGFQKGKLEEREKFENIVNTLDTKYQNKWITLKNKSAINGLELMQKQWRELKEQLQKEIGGNGE